MYSFIQFISEKKKMSNVQWSRLTHNDLRKRGGGRLTTFLDMIKDGDEFLTTKGIVKIDKAEYDRLSKEMDVSGYSTQIQAIGGQRLAYPADFFKTPEFGGKGAGSGTSAEDAELRSLNKQFEKIKEQDGVQEITLIVGKRQYKVASADSTPGTPKSDFHLLDSMGNEVVWISHKDGRRAKDVQQWGGISKAKEPAIFSHPETQKFIDDLKREYPNGLPRATTLMRKIKDTKLKNLSVYGNQFGQVLGRQNVSILLQGPVKLVKKGNSFALNANRVHVNGDTLTGDYEPVFAAIYKGDRSDAGVKGTRIVIMSKAGRKMTREI